MSNIKANDDEFVGKTYNYLTVIGFVYKNSRWLWKCQCKCGKIIVAYPNQVIRGKTESCGCYQRFITSKIHTKHGMSGTRLYKIWNGIKKRCNNSNAENYVHYGGRGIHMCSEWASADEGFENFYKWAMKNGYADNLTIERIDVNGDYSPHNCKWITSKQQHENTRKSIIVNIGGKKKPVGIWADEMGLKRSTVYGRIRKGMSPYEALAIHSPSEPMERPW